MAEHLDLVRQATPLIQQHRAQGEADFRMSPAVVESLGPAGIFRLLAPDRNTSVDLIEMVEIWEELGYADPAVAWAAMNSNAASRFFDKIKPELRDPYLGAETGFFGVGLPPTGFADIDHESATISGRWPVVSGCEYADFFIMNCLHRRDGEVQFVGEIPVMGFAILPADVGTIELTWNDVIAVKGSGSHAVTIAPTTIPTDLIAGIFDPDLQPTPWSRMPTFAIQSLALAAIATGIGRSAVESAIGQASKRRSAANGSAWVDYPSVQNTVASADIAVASLRAGLLDFCRELWAELEAGEVTSTTLRARCHSIADHSLRIGRHTVSDLFTVGSVDAIRSGHRLEQCLRDIHGFGVHWERYRSLHYDAGAFLMGGTPIDPRF